MMRKVIVLTGVLAAAVFSLGLAGTAAAAPDNKNTGTFEVDCEGLGEFLATENLRGGESSGGVVFGPDGQVIVAKGFDVTFQGSIAIDGGPTINFPAENEVEEPKGKGYEDRLIECDFTETFTETFQITADNIEFFEAFLAELGTPTELDAFLGADATFTGNASGTAQVLVPGEF